MSLSSRSTTTVSMPDFSSPVEFPVGKNCPLSFLVTFGESLIPAVTCSYWVASKGLTFIEHIFADHLRHTVLVNFCPVNTKLAVYSVSEGEKSLLSTDINRFIRWPGTEIYQGMGLRALFFNYLIIVPTLTLFLTSYEKIISLSLEGK